MRSQAVGAFRPAFTSKVVTSRCCSTAGRPWTDNLLDAASGADLLVCECNFFDKQVPGHLDYRTLVAKRPRLDCERIVITHMSEEMLSHLDDVEVEAAADGAVIAL